MLWKYIQRHVKLEMACSKKQKLENICQMPQQETIFKNHIRSQRWNTPKTLGKYFLPSYVLNIFSFTPIYNFFICLEIGENAEMYAHSLRYDNLSADDFRLAWTAYSKFRKLCTKAKILIKLFHFGLSTSEWMDFN